MSESAWTIEEDGTLTLAPAVLDAIAKQAPGALLSALCRAHREAIEGWLRKELAPYREEPLPVPATKDGGQDVVLALANGVAALPAAVVERLVPVLERIVHENRPQGAQMVRGSDGRAEGAVYLYPEAR